MTELTEDEWYILNTIDLPRDWYWLPEDFEKTPYYYQYWAGSDTYHIEISWDINNDHSIRTHKIEEISEDGIPLFDMDHRVFHSSHETGIKAIETAIDVMKEINNSDYPLEESPQSGE